MKINRDRLAGLNSMRVTATPEPWVYTEGSVRDKNGHLIAYICEPGTEPDFQQATNGEFIAAVGNEAKLLLETISFQHEIIERLTARVIRLEANVYGDEKPAE